MKRNTIDIDPVRLPNGYIVPVTEEGLRRITYKIRMCPGLIYLQNRTSPSDNGIHLQFWCLWDCDRCRLVYDSPWRFKKDLDRPPHSRDVVWSEKVYKKGGRFIRLPAGDWRR